MSATSAGGRVYETTMGRLRSEGRLPAFDQGFTTSQNIWEVADFVVDLDAAFRKAKEAKAQGLQVFADVVRVPKDFQHTIGDQVRRVTVVARRMEVEQAPAQGLRIDFS